MLHRYDKNNEADAGLYVSYRLEDNSWTKAKSLGDHINMLNVTWASLSPDGEHLFILGLGYGIYWLRTELIDYLRKVDLNISERLYGALYDQGIDSACAEYFEMKNRHVKYVELDEFFLNQRGFQLLQAGDIARSIGLFRICVAAFPASWNAHDSLAEAYLAAGETEQAKIHYRRSLELNPENGNARRRLNELEMN
jgi:tetratricopeptide (TPR) repeat protein